MNTLKNIIVLVLILLSVVACKSDKEPEIKIIESTPTINTNTTKKLDTNATYAKVEFSIDGMTCAMGCAKTIEKKMAKMEGVKSAKVDFDKRLAMVEYDEAKVTPTSLEETVSKVADIYKVKDMHKVVDFDAEKKVCKADCKEACCATKSEAEKMACKADCEKACCNDEKKSE